jgi:hypothetical protein
MLSAEVSGVAGALTIENNIPVILMHTMLAVNGVLKGVP